MLFRRYGVVFKRVLAREPGTPPWRELVQMFRRLEGRGEVRGGRFVSGETLLRFYVLHCVAIPLAVALLIAIHFWRVRKDGGISGPL